MLPATRHLALLLALTPCLAHAATPLIEHTPPEGAQAGKELVLRAKVTSSAAIADARAFWRVSRANFESAPFARTGDQLQVTLLVPAGAEFVEYFLSATDAKTLAEGTWHSKT